MDRLDMLRVFIRVAELGSFTRAAEALNLQKGAASLAVQQLEASLGTRLLQRTTRRVSLTQDGLACYERARDLLADAEELASQFRQAPHRLSGRLRVDMTTGIAQNYVIPRLPEFTQLHPDIEFEISATDRRVDPIREGFDCVVRVGTLQDSTLIARHLGVARIINCASPDYLQRNGTPLALADLSRHRLIRYAVAFGGPAEEFEYPEGDTYRTIAVPGSVTVNNAAAYIASCLAGFGLIQVPAFGVMHHLADGSLVEVLPDHHAAPMPVSILHAYRRHVPQRVRVFMDWLAEVVKPAL